MSKKYLILSFFVLSSFWLHAGEALSGKFIPSVEHEAVFHSKLSTEMPTAKENTNLELILSVAYTEMPSTEEGFREKISLKLANTNSGDVLIHKASVGGSLNFWVIAEVLEFEGTRNYIFHNCVIPTIGNSNLSGNEVLQLIRLNNYRTDLVDFLIVSTPTFLSF